MPDAAIKIARNGRIVYFNPLAPAAWPWCVAYFLALAARIDKASYWAWAWCWVESVAARRRPSWGRVRLVSVVQWAVSGCEVCGARALWLSGRSGRCGEHRSVVSSGEAYRRLRRGGASASIDAWLNERDASLRYVASRGSGSGIGGGSSATPSLVAPDGRMVRWPHA